MKQLLRYFIYLIAGFYCGMVGWAGVSGLVGLALYQLTKAGKLDISYDAAFLICLIAGGILGCIPFGIIGSDWVLRKWPGEENPKETSSS